MADPQPAIIHRLRTKAALPAAARGVIGIQLAPAFVACYAWLCVNGNDFDTFALILLGYGLLQLFLCSGWCVGFCRWLQPGHVGFLVRLIGDGERVAAVVAEPARGRYASAGTGLFALANLLLIGLMVKTLWLVLRGETAARQNAGGGMNPPSAAAGAVSCRLTAKLVQRRVFAIQIVGRTDAADGA